MTPQLTGSYDSSDVATGMVFGVLNTQLLRQLFSLDFSADEAQPDEPIYYMLDDEFEE